MTKKTKTKKTKPSKRKAGPSRSKAEPSMWNVTFSGDYFSLTTWAEATDEDSAISEATDQISEYYGWRMKDCAFDILAESQNDQ